MFQHRMGHPILHLSGLEPPILRRKVASSTQQPGPVTVVMGLGLKSDLNMHRAPRGSLRVRIEARHEWVEPGRLPERGPNEWSQPHSHPNERFITVLAGTFLIGTGAKFDKNNTVAIGPGGVVHDIPNQMHYDGTGPEGATLEFIAMGPAARN